MDQSKNEPEDVQLDPPLMWIIVPTAIAAISTIVFLVAFFLR